MSSIVRISMLTVRERKSKGGIDYWEPGWREQGREGNKEDRISLSPAHGIGLV